MTVCKAQFLSGEKKNLAEVILFLVGLLYFNW